MWLNVEKRRPYSHLVTVRIVLVLKENFTVYITGNTTKAAARYTMASSSCLMSRSLRPQKRKECKAGHCPQCATSSAWLPAALLAVGTAEIHCRSGPEDGCKLGQVWELNGSLSFVTSICHSFNYFKPNSYRARSV